MVPDAKTSDLLYISDDRLFDPRASALTMPAMSSPQITALRTSPTMLMAAPAQSRS